MIKIRGGSLFFFGQSFGRPYDNFHSIASVQNIEHGGQIWLVITFSDGEILSVLNPCGVQNRQNEFIIKDADEIKFEYSYIEPKAASDRKKFIKFSKLESGEIMRTDSFGGHKIWRLKENENALEIG